MELNVSIHAPTRGATEECGFSDLAQGFQSTHPRGVRPILLVEGLCLYPFQSTHPRGVRPILLVEGLYINPFQSTHPRGVRLKKIHFVIDTMCFNPRTHAGCDRKFLYYYTLSAFQ